MKKIFSLILVITVLFSLAPYSVSVQAAGSGTKDDPYVITNEAEFNAIRNNPEAHYILNADVVLSENYVPFEFLGSLVGANEEKPYSVTVNISGMSSYTSPLGLFTVLKGAELKNIALKGKVSGVAYVGGFFGRATETEADSDGITSGNTNVKLENLINYAAVSGSGSYVGGIGGAVSESTSISRLTNSGSVSAGNFAGGLFGICFDGELLVNNGYVYTKGSYAGGITAELKGELKSCYNSGDVSAESYAGGITGSVSAKELIIESSANYGNVEGRTSSSLNRCGGIVGGIKRLADVSVIIKNSLNCGSVSAMNYICPQYVEYDATNFIKAENCFYLSEEDEEIEGASSFTDDYIYEILKTLSDFEMTAEYQYPMVKGLKYLEYIAPVIEDVSDDTDDEVVEKTISSEEGLLNSLGITYENTDLSSNVTRGMFADLISRAFLYNQQYHKDSALPVFADVDTSYGYYDSVKVISDLKIMGAVSYNKFYPDKNITLNEAVTALIRATGYEIYAKANGGYPSGYLYQAKVLNITKGVETAANGILTYENALKLIYNSLFVNVTEVNGVSQDGNILLTDSENKYINKIHDVYEYDVIVSDNGATNKDSVEFGSGLIEITNFKDNTSRIIAGNTEIMTLLGIRVKAYIREDGINKDEMIYYAPHKDSNIETLYGKTITDVNDNEIIYEAEPDSGKSERIKLNTVNYPTVYINGKRSVTYTSKDFMSDSAIIYAIDNDNDRCFERINIYDFDYDVIAGSVTENKTIFGMTGSVYDLVTDPEKSAISFIYGSEVKSISDITSGDVISVVKSDIKKGNKNLYYLLVSSAKAEGKISSWAEDYITVGNDDYDLSYTMKNTYSNYDKDLKTGDEVTLYLNYANEVSYIYNGVVSGRTYGFILAAGMENSFDGTGVVRMLTESGEVKQFKLAEKVKKEDIKVNDIKSFVAELKAYNNDLIVYQLNSDNEISNVIFAKYPTVDEAENISNFTLRSEIAANSRYSGYTLDGVGANNTIVFRVPQNYSADGSDCAVAKNMFVRSQYYSNVKFYDVEQSGIAAVALYRTTSNAESFNSRQHSGYVYIKTVSGYNQESGNMKKIYYYDKGVEKSCFVDPEVVFPSLNTNITVTSLDELKTGDYFCFETDSYGNMKKISVIYKAENFGNATEGVIYLGGDGTANNYTLSLFEGNLQYKSSSLLTLRLPGDKYKIEPFNYNPATAVVYKINMAKGKISLTDTTELVASNFAAKTTGNRILVVANKNTLQEVMIYE